MATSKSAADTFSRLGMFGDRAMPRTNHIPDPNARKFVHQSDKTFGNCYSSILRCRARAIIRQAVILAGSTRSYDNEKRRLKTLGEAQNAPETQR